MGRSSSLTKASSSISLTISTQSRVGPARPGDVRQRDSLPRGGDGRCGRRDSSGRAHGSGSARTVVRRVRAEGASARRARACVAFGLSWLVRADRDRRGHRRPRQVVEATGGRPLLAEAEPSAFGGGGDLTNANSNSANARSLGGLAPPSVCPSTRCSDSFPASSAA
jgi:hypothetical protein